MKILTIKDRIYHRDIYFVMRCSNKKFSEYIEKKYELERVESYGADATFLKVYNNGKGYCKYFIWIGEFDWKLHQYAMLSHEINHLVFQAMRDIGIELCDDSEEAYTYYMQRVTTDILVAIDKLEIREKKNEKIKKKSKKISKSKTGKNRKNQR